MSLFKSVVNKIKDNRERRLSGKYNSILTPFKRLNKVFPGFEKGKFIIVTANSGVGKTQITKYLFVLGIYNFCKENNIPLKIFYFALEETKENFWLTILSNKLKQVYKLDIETSELKSLGENALSEDIITKVEELEASLLPMMECITVIDDVTNPFGLYKIGRQYALDNGKMVGEGYNQKYEANNPEEMVITITDHISLISREKDPDTGEKMDQWQSIGKYSQDYCLKGFCKRYNFLNIFVQQQESSKEKQQYTFKGDSIEDKLEPTLDGLATNKETQREADLVFGLFAPDRFKIEDHRGYDIRILKDNYRSLKVLKDRNYGLANNYIPLLFNGKTNHFYELPRAEEMTKSRYDDTLKFLNK